jgi:hypothetical protein
MDVDCIFVDLQTKKITQCPNYIYMHWNLLRSCHCARFGHISAKGENVNYIGCYIPVPWIDVNCIFVDLQTKKITQCPHYIYMHWHWLRSCRCARFGHISAKDENVNYISCYITVPWMDVDCIFVDLQTNAQTTYTCIDTGSEVVIVLDLVI